MKVENKKYFVDLLNSSKANKFTANFHYSGVGFPSAKLNLGVYNKSDSLLVGVLQWGRSFQVNIKLNRYVKEEIALDEYLELNRFCMDDTEGRNSESQAISLGIKWIQKNRPDIKLLVSYAGRKEGNYGYIYQATNWEYLGYFVSDGFWRVDGEERHKMTLWQRTKKSEKKFLEALKDLYSDIVETRSKQFIYIQRLDKNLTPASEILPYPKPSNEHPIVIKEIIHKGTGKVPLIENKKNKIKYYYNPDELLFSRVTLIKRGDILPSDRGVTNYKNKYIGRYNDGGKLVKLYFEFNGLKEDGFIRPLVQNAIKNNKRYLNNYFKLYDNEESVLNYIDLSLYKAPINYKNKYIGRYSEGGELEKTYFEFKELEKEGFSKALVQNSIRQNKMYLKKYFKLYDNEEDALEQIEVPIFGIIDDIPFAIYADAAKYLGVSRQAVHVARKRNSKQIAGKKVEWY